MASIEDEIQKALNSSREMIDAYLGWFQKTQFAEVHNTVYNDMLEFVNFRVETADSCLHLIAMDKIADSLGLSRALLENYLLLILMCRGRKFFQLQSLEEKPAEDFEQYLREQQAKLEEHKKTSSTGALYIGKYPRAKRHIMYVFEGLTSNDDDGFIIPFHFFQFQEFHPETMRLKDTDYFEYDEPSPEMRRSQKDQRVNATGLYRFYLSYDALLQCLELNDLADDSIIARIEAHYTFLGKFLHPTHNAARLLHERSNFYDGGTAIGMNRSYTKSSVLLAALYNAYLLAGIFDEVAGSFESAPKMYIEDAATSDLRSLTAAVYANFSYFWFLFNRPPLWDKFNYAIHHVDDATLAGYGGYANIPDSEVPFDWDIHRHFTSAIGGWSNARVGTYRSPLG